MTVAPLSIVLVTSSGGVLLDLLALRAWWERHDSRWIAVPAIDTRELLSGEEVLWRDEVSIERPGTLARTVLDARRQLRDRRPDVIVSAGTGLAVPWFLAGRSLGVRCTWVETLNLVGRSGRAATVCQRLASRVLVQRPELLASRRRPAFIGELY